MPGGAEASLPGSAEEGRPSRAAADDDDDDDDDDDNNIR